MIRAGHGCPQVSWKASPDSGFPAPTSLEATKLLFLEYGTNPAPARPEIVKGSHTRHGRCSAPGPRCSQHSLDLLPAPHIYVYLHLRHAWHPVSWTGCFPFSSPKLLHSSPTSACTSTSHHLDVDPVMPSLIPSIWLPRPLTLECCCQFAQPFARLACAVGACVNFVQINEMSPPRAVTVIL